MSEDDIPDADTAGIDAGEAIKRWANIGDRGHPLGPAQYDGERSVDTGADKTEADRDV